MKAKLIFISAIFFLVISQAMALSSDGGDVTFPTQDSSLELDFDWKDHSELYLSWGSMSVIPPLVGFFGAIGGALSGADEISGDMSGVIGFGANTYLFNWLFVGVSGSFENFSMRYDDKEAYSINFWTAQLRAGLQWHIKKLYIYHSVSGGVGYFTGARNHSFSSNMVRMYNLNYLGIKLPVYKNLHGFCEFNIGSGAFASLGLSYKF